MCCPIRSHARALVWPQANAAVGPALGYHQTPSMAKLKHVRTACQLLNIYLSHPLLALRRNSLLLLFSVAEFHCRATVQRVKVCFCPCEALMH